MNKKQKILGERFKNLRAELDTIDSTCTQDKLAQMLDLTKAQISEYETGRKTPSVRALMAYREKFNVPIEYLISEKYKSRNFENQRMSSELAISDNSIKTILKIKELSNELKIKANSNFSIVSIFDLLLEDYRLFSSFLLELTNCIHSTAKQNDIENEILNTKSKEPVDIIRKLNDIQEKNAIAYFKLEKILKKIIHNILKEAVNGKHSSKKK